MTAPITLTTRHLDLRLGANPLEVVALTHTGHATPLVADGEQLLYVRFPERPSDPVFLYQVDDVEVQEQHVTFRAADASGSVVATCRIDATEAGLQFSLEVTAPEPVWMAEWLLSGLDLADVIVPALGGQAIARQMPAGERLAYKYPFWWNAQFAVGAASEERGLWLYTRQAPPHFQVLRVNTVSEDDDRFELGLGFEAEAPLTARRLAATWTLAGYEGGWQTPADAHRRWLEDTFALQPYTQHPHLPAWTQALTLILEIWGMRKDRGRPAHPFDAMIERIEAFATLHPPEQTLLYLPGFAEGGIDSNAPDYNPAPLLGGREDFGRLVRRAHALGYRVMIHTNVLALTHTHTRYADFRAHQVVDPFGRRLGWGLDLDGDWLTEPYFAYMNPGVEAWGDLMEQVLGELITTCDLDGVFLDQTLLAFNVSRGPDFVTGMRRHIERLQQAFPDVLFGGEGQHEQVLPALPWVQIHGLDSIKDVHGLDGQQPWRRVHPVSSYLFGRYTQFVAHLLTKHPSSTAFARQQAAYDLLGVLPALVLYGPNHALDTPEVRRLLDAVRDRSRQRAEA
jgi:hypothetical protein